MLAPTLATTLLAATLAPQDWQTPDVAKVRNAVQAAAEKTGRPAVMLAVVTGDEVFLTHATGKVGKDRTADAATLFPMGTVSRAVANLTFAKMDKAKQLPLRKEANKVLKPFVLRDEDDIAVDNTLAEILFDQVKLPYYENVFPVAQAGRWSAERAVLDNAFVPTIETIRLSFDDWGLQNDQLAYALVQHAAQKSTQRSWTALVREHVSKPLGMRDFIADGRTGLPTNVAMLYSKGLFGLKYEQKAVLSGIAAGYGAWTNSADLGRLLRGLLAAADGADSAAKMQELAETDPVFANFTVDKEPHPHLVLHGGGAGMIGGLAIYPQFGRAWGAFANYRSGNESGMPGLVRRTLEQQLLPKPKPKEDPQWNTAVGLGGAGGTLVGTLLARHTGEWHSKVRFAGKEHLFRMWIANGRVRYVQFGDRRKKAVTCVAVGNQIHIKGQNLIPVREDVKPGCQMILVSSKNGADTRFDGNVELRSKLCWMTFRVAFTKVK